MSTINYWKNALKASNLLMKNFNSDRDNVIVLTNTIIVILVSGFEQYCKARFEEMEKKEKIQIMKLF